MKNKNVIEPIAVEDIGTKQEGDITMNKVYTFRKLNSTDLFLMFKIIGKIGIKDFLKSLDNGDMKDLMNSAKNKDNNSTMVGISIVLEVADVIISNLPKCETEIFQILSNTSNLTVEQVKELDFVTFVEMVVEFIKKEEFKDFFKVVLKSFKPVN